MRLDASSPPFRQIPEAEWLRVNALAFVTYDRFPVFLGHKPFFQGLAVQRADERPRQPLLQLFRAFSWLSLVVSGLPATWIGGMDTLSTDSARLLGLDGFCRVASFDLRLEERRVAIHLAACRAARAAADLIGLSWDAARMLMDRPVARELERREANATGRESAYSVAISTSGRRFPAAEVLDEPMILHDVGCSPACTFVVKKLDSDYFVEE